MKALSIFYLFFFLSSCTQKESRKEHKMTVKVCDSLYVEIYSVFGSGAFGGDLLSDWLTDSTNFRKYIGTFDDAHGGISYKCNGDTVFVTQLPDGQASSSDTIEVRHYVLSKLKTQRNLNEK